VSTRTRATANNREIGELKMFVTVVLAENSDFSVSGVAGLPTAATPKL